MHWITEILIGYKIALEAFEIGEEQGKEYLVENELHLGICHWLILRKLDKEAQYVQNYTLAYNDKHNNKSSWMLTDTPRSFMRWWPSSRILETIKIRMQHLHKMREELVTTKETLTHK